MALTAADAEHQGDLAKPVAIMHYGEWLNARVATVAVIVAGIATHVEQKKQVIPLVLVERKHPRG